MKAMDSIGLKMCSYQAKLFEASLLNCECSSGIFVRRFMNSALANRMDSNGYVFDAFSTAEAFDEIEAEYGASSYGSSKYSSEEMHWMGYIYRYWAYISERSSKQIYKLVKPELLRKLYLPYHSLDPLQAIERICEETGCDAENTINNIARGVSILREVRRQYAENEAGKISCKKVKPHKSKAVSYALTPYPETLLGEENVTSGYHTESKD